MSSSIPSAPGGSSVPSSITASPHADQRTLQGPLPQQPLLSPENRAVSHTLNENKSSAYSVDYSNASKSGTAHTTYGSNNYPAPINTAASPGPSDVERQRFMMQAAASYAIGNPVHVNHSSGSTDPANNVPSVVPSPSRPQLIGQPIPSPQQMLQMKQQQQLRQMKLQQMQRSQYQKHQEQLALSNKEAASANNATVSSARDTPEKHGPANAHSPHVSYPSSTGGSSFHQRGLNGASATQNHISNSSNSQPSSQRVEVPQSHVAPMGDNRIHVSQQASAAFVGTTASVEAKVPPITSSEATSAAFSKANAPRPPTNALKVKQTSSSNLSVKSNATSTIGVASAASATSTSLPTEQVVSLLARCNWIDQTVWASRQLLGGQSVNGFMRATATVQRIKKQRARQNVRSGKKSATAASALGGSDLGASSAPSSTNLSLEEQQAEEDVLKKDVMNARTAKKIKQELDAGIQFCVVLHDTIRSIIQKMDPSIPPLEPLSSSTSSRNPSRPGFSIPSVASQVSSSPLTQNGTSGMPKSGNNKKASNSSSTASSTNTKTPTAPPQSPSHPSLDRLGPSSQTSPSNSTGSTLRRYRKTKIPPSGEVLIQLPEIDEATGKRHSAKKDHPHRLSDVIRYRALRKGDRVAARVTSRDLWILARIVKDYPGTNMSPLEFLRLSDTRREQLFKEKVLIQDEEERDGGTASAVLVSRSLVLPLPRSIAEAAEWGNYYRFFKKGSRVYAMYPNATALYTATVVDCTTYCLGDEDVIVVEFDGDEPDAVTGKIPTCHIPARFVTLIPKEFPGAQGPNNSTNKRKRASPVAPSMDVDIMNGVLDDLNFDGDLPGLDQLDDLDFDLLGDS